MRVKRPEVSKQILLSLLVIALSTVIAVQSGSVVPNEAVADPFPTGIKEAAKESEKQPVVEAIEPRKEPEVKSASGESKPDSKSGVESVEKSDPKVDSEANKRKARADSTPAEAPKSEAKAAPEKAAPPATKSDPKAASKASQSTKQQQQQQQQRLQQEQASKNSSKSKLPPNLGTVTSTGSGGHYLSKHDAYSAIAEKHGALAQDAMKKSDKRQLQSFGGIQKASGGLGDVLSPFKGVTDSGLARTLGASMRSIMKSKYSVPAYVASALLGAVALMAFYESPISPLPVPPLPEPPVGRFPPEMPNLPVGTQVPFRGNQQQQQYGQNYNQRSLNQPQQQQLGYLNQQAQQVLFPGQNAQQRQMNLAGPVQLAASLLNKQVAQRKSSPDYDLSSSRSFFGGSNQLQKLGSAPPVQQKQGSFLSYFGLGNNGASQATSTSVDQGSMQQPLMSAVNPANTLIAAASAIESKGQSSGLSNSHLVNKVKSYFSRSGPASTGSSSSSANVASSNSNLFDQYQKMSFIQALMKDTAFIPGFLTSNRKSSLAAPHSQSSAGSKIQSVANALSPGNGPAARMQVGTEGQLPSGAQQLISMPTNKAAQSKPSVSGHGLARIAHALLETFSSGISQRSISPSSNGQDARKSVQNDDASSLASATSLLSDIVSSYNAAQEQAPQQSQEQAKSLAPSQSQQQQATSGNQQPQQQSAHQQDSQATGRSAEAAATATSDEAQHSAQQQASSSPNSSKQQAPVSSASSEPHVRKTRSIGHDNNDNNQERRDWQPSKAAQINNVIDFVSDSYSQNRLLFNFFMNQVGLSQAVPYMEQILVSNEHH